MKKISYFVKFNEKLLLAVFFGFKHIIFGPLFFFTTYPVNEIRSARKVLDMTQKIIKIIWKQAQSPSDITKNSENLTFFRSQYGNTFTMLDFEDIYIK